MELIPNVVHESWHPHLYPLFQSSGMKQVKSLLNDVDFQPKAKDIFNVFSMPIDKIKVVILGQDPYPTPGVAIGYAFAVSYDTHKPPSLRMIEREVGYEVDRTLVDWRRQGVFLLNTALTVETGKAGSHVKYWNGFTKRVIKIIGDNVSPIWLLWGRHAKEFEPIILSSAKAQIILRAAHPAAEVYRGDAGFLRCGHFRIVNRILAERNQGQIKF